MNFQLDEHEILVNYVPSRRYGLPRESDRSPRNHRHDDDDDAGHDEAVDEEFDEVEYLFEHSDYEEDDYLFIDRLVAIIFN